VLVITVLGGSDAKDDGVSFLSSRLTPQGAPDVEIFEDLDRDGDIDIILFENRGFSVFFSKNDSYPTMPDLEGKIPSKAVFLEVGDVQGQNIREHLFMCREGVFLYSYIIEEKRFEVKPVLEYEIPILPIRMNRCVIMDFYQEMTGDELEDIIVPELERYLIFENKGNGSFKRWGEIPFKPKGDFFTEPLSQTGRFKEVVHLPRLFSGKAKGNDIVILYDGTWVTHFERNEKGKFEVSDHRPLYGKDIREYEESSRAYFGKSIYFEDLNNDANHTLIIAHNKNGKIDFLSGAGNKDPFNVEYQIRCEGWVLSPVFSDLNGDGMKDLILPSIEKIGIFTILRVFFTSKFDITYKIFFNRKESLYPIAPDLSRSVSLPLSFSIGPEGLNIQHSLIYSFEGDYNDDGFKDLLIKHTKNTLGVFYGKKGADFAHDLGKKVIFNPLPNCSTVTTRVCDINKDGISDIFLHQKSYKDKADSYTLFLSKK